MFPLRVFCYDLQLFYVVWLYYMFHCIVWAFLVVHHVVGTAINSLDTPPTHVFLCERYTVVLRTYVDLKGTSDKTQINRRTHRLRTASKKIVKGCKSRLANYYRNKAVNELNETLSTYLWIAQIFIRLLWHFYPAHFSMTYTRLM